VRSKLSAIAVSGSHLISVIWGRGELADLEQVQAERLDVPRTRQGANGASRGGPPLSGMTGPILDRNKLHRNTPAVRLADSNQKSRRNSCIGSFPSAWSEHI